MSKPDVDKATTADFLKARSGGAKAALRLAVGVTLVGGVLAIAQAWVCAWIISDVVFNGAGLTEQTPRLLILFALALARFACSAFGETQSATAAAEVHRTLRREVLSHINALGPVGLADRATGETVAALTDSLRAIEPYYSRYLPAASLAALLPSAIFLAVVPYDWISAIVLIVTAPMIPLFMVLIGAGAERLNQRQWRKLARLSGHLLDAIQGLTTLKVFGASRREAANVAAMADDYRRETMGILRLAFLSSLVLEFFASISIALVAVFIGFRLLWGDLSFFNGFFVLLLAPEFYLPLRTLGSAYHSRMEAIGAGERIVALLSLEPAGARPPDSGSVKHVDVDGRDSRIQLDGVSVEFPDGRIGLRSVDLEIIPGETLALVGPSGGGKSMVLNLLLGFVSPSKGHVRVNDLVLDDIDLSCWRDEVTYLPQRPHVFDASIRSNIAMQFDGGPVDGDRLLDAARRAHIDHVISALPEGFDTRLGERGYGLSGGEVQRLALARAFYRDAPIVLIDEATAHLDSESEAIVADGLANLVANRTCVMIAHRSATLQFADRVAVIDDGTVKEITTPSGWITANPTALVEPFSLSPSTGPEGGEP